MITSFGWPEAFFLVFSVRWTLLLTLIAFLGGGVLGGTIALLRLAKSPTIRWLATIYIQLIQSIPVLMVLFLAYYGLSLAGFELPPLLAASVSLGIYVSAYLAEIWRGAIEAVPFQQWEASASLALSRPQQYRYIIIPQALRLSLPPTVGFLVQLVKNTSIVSVVGFVELSRAGQLVNFLICFPLSRLSRRLERVLHVGRPH